MAHRPHSTAAIFPLTPRLGWEAEMFSNALIINMLFVLKYGAMYENILFLCSKLPDININIGLQ